MSHLPPAALAAGGYQQQGGGYDAASASAALSSLHYPAPPSRLGTLGSVSPTRPAAMGPRPPHQDSPSGSNAPSIGEHPRPRGLPPETGARQVWEDHFYARTQSHDIDRLAAAYTEDAVLWVSHPLQCDGRAQRFAGAVELRRALAALCAAVGRAPDVAVPTREVDERCGASDVAQVWVVWLCPGGAWQHVTETLWLDDMRRIRRHAVAVLEAAPRDLHPCPAELCGYCGDGAAGASGREDAGSAMERKLSEMHEQKQALEKRLSELQQQALAPGGAGPAASPSLSSQKGGSAADGQSHPSPGAAPSRQGTQSQLGAAAAAPSRQATQSQLGAAAAQSQLGAPSRQATQSRLGAAVDAAPSREATAR